jgi:hypothetical protein
MLFLQDDGFSEIFRTRTDARDCDERESNPQQHER